MQYKRSRIAKLKYRFRKFKRQLRYRLIWLVAILAVVLVFVAAFFLVHGGNINQGQGEFLQGGVTDDNPGGGDHGGGVQNGHNTFNEETMEVHYIDVGQGDATLIKCGDKAMLIDAGDNSKGTKVQSYLKKQGVSKLDYVIGTHPDGDHIGGLDVIIYKFICGTILMPDKSSDSTSYRDVIAAMESKSYKQTFPTVGNTYALGNATFTIIAPNKNYEESNNASIGIILHYGQKSFLFTGDAETDSEMDIIAGGIDIKCDVYKAGHHGSKSSSCAALLNAASPAYAVISCGKNNDYGHPHTQTINQFTQRGIKIFRTDEHGSVVAVTDGKDIKWMCERGY